jgi:hypothetical protein
VPQMNHTFHRWVAVPSVLPSKVESEVRLTALRAGWWLGWLSVAAVLAGLALDLPARDRPALIVLTALAAVGNGAAMAIPWQRWLTEAAEQGWLLRRRSGEHNDLLFRLSNVGLKAWTHYNTVIASQN